MKLLAVLSILSLAPLSWACLLPEERGVRGTRRHVNRRQTGNTGVPIGTGDRFNGGAKFPRGLGSEPSANLTTILSVAEIESALLGLENEYGIELFTTPYKTYEGRIIHGAKVGGTGGDCNGAYHVYFNGGIHARERGGPDNLIYFISDLLYANKTQTALTWGSTSYTAAQVSKALAAGIVFVPLSNPDGVAWDQKTNSCWRKNRNPASATTGQAATIGVDLNRNFDFLWDFPNLFAPSVAAGGVASTSPRAEDYHGTSAFSEPETKSIKWVMDTFTNIRWFLDLHSDAGVVLYSWGSDDNQSKLPYMNFRNSSYNKVRGVMPDTRAAVYSEYSPQEDWDDNKSTATKIGTAMNTAAGRKYQVEQASVLYPTSGASDDYAYSRHFANPSLNLIHAFTVEFGFGNAAASCGFYPTLVQYHKNILETNAGFMELLLSAQDIGLGNTTACLST